MQTDDTRVIDTLVGMSSQPEIFAEGSVALGQEIEQHPQWPRLQQVMMNEFTNALARGASPSAAALHAIAGWFCLGVLAERRARENAELEQLAK